MMTSGGGAFRESLLEAEPIRMREPLAALLGAFKGEDDVLEYAFSDAVKMAGHSCPTVTGAFLCCREALAVLYPGDETPVRGEVEVTAYGEPDEGAYGVMSQVMGLITGAAPATGFKGLAGRFKRKDLLIFSSDKPDPQAVSFRFKRLDTGRAVLVRFFPWAVPFPGARSQRMAELMEKVLAGEAAGGEKQEFQDLWMEKIGWMLQGRDIHSWLRVEEA